MSTASIMSALRNQVLRDPGTFFSSNTPGDGVMTVIDLPVENVEPAGLVVSVVASGQATPQATPLQAGSAPGQGDYYLYERDGIILLSVPLAVGTNLIVNGTYYKLFNSDDLNYYLQTAFLQHTHGMNPPIYLDTPDPNSPVPAALQRQLPQVEEYLVALEAALEGIWSKIIEASDEVNVVTPDGVSIPDSSRYQQLTDLQQRLFEEWSRLASQLNVGLDRIEMFTLRRISKTTNRYVPLYEGREFDTRDWPTRQLPMIDADLTQNVNYVGFWNNSVTYYPNQLVDRDASDRFLCVKQNSGVDPLTDTNNAATPGYGTYWARSTINTAWQGNAGW